MIYVSVTKNLLLIAIDHRCAQTLIVVTGAAGTAHAHRISHCVRKFLWRDSKGRFASSAMEQKDKC